MNRKIATFRVVGANVDETIDDLVKGPARILGIYRTQVAGQDTTPAATTNIVAETSGGEKISEQVRWHSALYDPTNAGGRFLIPHDIPKNEDLVLEFSGMAAAPDLDGYVLYERADKRAR